MKRTFSLILLSFLMAIMPVCTWADNNRLFKELSDNLDIETVYIGPAALRFAQGARLDVGDFGTIGAGIKDVKSVEIVECDKPNYFPKIDHFLDEVVERLKLEVIVETKDDDEATRIYAVIPEDSDKNTSLESVLIETRDKNELSLVYLQGTIDISRFIGNNHIRLSAGD